MGAASLDRLPDWIVIGQEAWDEIERRNQLLIRALAARNPRAKFLFAEIPLRPREARRWRWPVPRQVAENIWAIRPVRPVPDSVSQAVADRVECAQIRRAARALGLRAPFVWTQDPRAANLVADVPHAGLVYDLTDDWAAFESDPAARAVVQERIERLGRRATAVLACSHPLEAGARKWSDRVTYLPNAVDALDAPAPQSDLDRIPRPRLGYAGTLHGSRVDVNLLYDAAVLRPDWSFVFLGPNQLDEASKAKLFSLPNVHDLGTRPHSAVRGYLVGLDVCLLPNLVNSFTQSLDPLKIYEYLAAGRPVVATPVRNVPELEEFVAVATDASELVARAEEAMAADSEDERARRRAAVATETWDARAESIEMVLGVGAGSEPPGTDETSVVIVSFNTREMLAQCLDDLMEQREAVQVIVVDNSSTDGSVEMVRERFPDIELIALDENVGFARANNIAFDHCRGRFILLLNSDAFMAPGSLGALIAVAERRVRAGAVGPRLLNVDGSLQRSAWPFPDPTRLLAEAVALHRPLRRVGLIEDLGTWAHDEERTVDFLIGACLLLRREALAEVRGFDEEFWLYGEEADLEKRLWDLGWEVVFTPAAEVVHVGGASSKESHVRLRRFYSGQQRFLKKHGGRFAWPLARVALFVGAVLRRRWASVRVAIEMK